MQTLWHVWFSLKNCLNWWKTIFWKIVFSFILWKSFWVYNFFWKSYSKSSFCFTNIYRGYTPCQAGFIVNISLILLKSNFSKNFLFAQFGNFFLKTKNFFLGQLCQKYFVIDSLCTRKTFDQICVIMNKFCQKFFLF